MALFRRKNNQTVAEIESYYEQQNRRSGSTGRAWIMAILAIVATALVLAILFFGGRWVYNSIVDNDTDTTQQDVNSGTVGIDGFDSDNSESTTNDSDEGTPGSSVDNDSNTEGNVSDEAASTDESNADRIAGSNTDENIEDDDTTGSVAGSSTNIPNTGPGETALIASLLAGFVATVFSYKKKLQ